jgi:hypothetical protein
VEQQSTGHQEEVGIRPIRLIVGDQMMDIISEMYANQKNETEKEEDMNEVEEQAKVHSLALFSETAKDEQQTEGLDELSSAYSTRNDRKGQMWMDKKKGSRAETAQT